MLLRQREKSSRLSSHGLPTPAKIIVRLKTLKKDRTIGRLLMILSRRPTRRQGSQTTQMLLSWTITLFPICLRQRLKSFVATMAIRRTVEERREGEEEIGSSRTWSQEEDSFLLLRPSIGLKPVLWVM